MSGYDDYEEYDENEDQGYYDDEGDEGLHDPGMPEFSDRDHRRGHGAAGGLDTQALIERARNLVATARAIPLSSSIRVEREDLLELLDEALTRYPEEVRQARWVLRDSEELKAKARREAEDIIDEARLQAARMVERTELARQARHEAQRVVEAAQQDARKLVNQTDDYCDQKLANFEIALDRTMKTVRAGRERLKAMVPEARLNSRQVEMGTEEEAEAFFTSEG